MYYVNKNLPEERVQVLLSEKQFSELPDDSPNIFKKVQHSSMESTLL